MAKPADDGAILVTGGSGVVGQALIPLLRGREALFLTHSAAVAAKNTVRADICEPQFGLSERAYRDLASRVSVIIHCAAITDFQDKRLELANVTGTENMVNFAAAAGAHLVHVSTAFVGSRDSASTAARYALSKYAAEQVVLRSGISATIARPSIVIGDSRTGSIAKYQAVYQVAAAVLTGRMPIAPVDPEWRLDVIAQDVVARSLMQLIDGSRAGTTVWLTSGRSALTLRETNEVLIDLASEWGQPVAPTRFVDPDMYHRLIVPTFLAAMPTRTRLSLTRLMDQRFGYMAVREAFPSTVAAILEGPVPDVAETLRCCMTEWARSTGRIPAIDDYERYANERAS